MENERKFSPQYIDALAECITGGSGSGIPNPIGMYRTGTEIVKLFRSLGYDVTYGNWSRVPFTQDLLNQINHKEDGFDRLIRIDLTPENSSTLN